MNIDYRNNKIKKVCENAEIARKQYGSEMAKKIHQRIDEIRAADNIEYLLKYHIGRCHSLVDNREGQYAMDLTHPYRLIFIEKNDTVVSVSIEEITDYH